MADPLPPLLRAATPIACLARMEAASAAWKPGDSADTLAVACPVHVDLGIIGAPCWTPLVAHAKPPRGEPGWCACDPFSATAEAEAMTPEAITCDACRALFASGLARVGGFGGHPELPEPVDEPRPFAASPESVGKVRWAPGLEPWPGWSRTAIDGPRYDAAVRDFWASPEPLPFRSEPWR